MAQIRYSYIARNTETKETFCGAKGQVAFRTIGALKNSMNMENKYNNDRYNYNLPIWEFYELDSEELTLTLISK